MLRVSQSPGTTVLAAFLFALALSGVGLAAPAATLGANSQGCNILNDPVFDTKESGHGIFGYLFVAGDQLTMTAGEPSDPGAATVRLRVDNVLVDTKTYPGTVTYTLPTGGAHDVQWGTFNATLSAGVAVTWTVSCTPGPADTTPPDVTINQAATQADPTSTSPINFTVVFSEPVLGFFSGSVVLSGTAGATTAVVTPPFIGITTYNVAVSGMTTSGTVIASIPPGAASVTDGSGNKNTASTSTDNTVTFIDTTSPTVTINQAATQADPTSTSPINFTAVFSEPVTGFASGDVTLDGSPPGSTAVVTEVAPNNGTTYNVAVSGMTTSGTVFAFIRAGAATDGSGNPNTASTSIDNTVTFVAPAAAPTCHGVAATIYVDAGGRIVGGPDNGKLYTGTLNGTSGRDVMVGTNAKDEIVGKAGDDRICGRGGNDELEGGAGRDRLFGDAGNDVLEGGDGNDTLTGGTGADRFMGGNGTDTATDFTRSQGDTKASVEIF